MNEIGFKCLTSAGCRIILPCPQPVRVVDGHGREAVFSEDVLSEQLIGRWARIAALRPRGTIGAAVVEIPLVAPLDFVVLARLGFLAPQRDDCVVRRRVRLGRAARDGCLAVGRRWLGAAAGTRRAVAGRRELGPAAARGGEHAKACLEALPWSSAASEDSRELAQACPVAHDRRKREPPAPALRRGRCHLLLAAGGLGGELDAPVSEGLCARVCRNPAHQVPLVALHVDTSLSLASTSTAHQVVYGK
mmetsp:Transcript_117814/g.334009  ORF Transcript_117814/g.334009 Transcript_117814/m.334009 type:complete len:248 (+) Transcript_117814:42-785(+)